MNEAQTIRIPPEFLDGVVLKQFKSISQTFGSCFGTVTVWHEAVQWLLRSFTTGEALRQAGKAMRSVKQLPREDEMGLYIRLTSASYHCENVHAMDEQMAKFNAGLGQSCRSLFLQYPQDNPYVPLLRLVNRDKGREAAQRARYRKTRHVYQASSKFNKLFKTNKIHTNCKSRSSAYAVNYTQYSEDYTMSSTETDTQAEEYMLAEGVSSNSHEFTTSTGYESPGYPPESLTTTQGTEESESILGFRNRPRVHNPAPKIQMD